MTEKFEIYKCNICGTIIEVVNSGVGVLTCCGQNMEHLTEKCDDETSERHKPVITVKDDNITIRIGKLPHEMTKEHYIQFIEAISSDKKYLKRKYLNIDEMPELEFICNNNKLTARALCNLHGLWKS